MIRHGSAIYINNSTPIIVNTIFEGNTEDESVYFENSYFTSLSFCDFYNNDGNFSGAYPPGGLGAICTINANGDSCDTYYNIFHNPMFLNPQNGNFYLQRGSPCIDAGDPASPLDPDSTIADIGAYYYDQTPQIPVVEDLTINIDEDDIILHWSPFTVVISYNIYRSTEPYFEVTGMTPIGITTLPEFLDENVLTTGRYFYKVTCVTESSDN